MGAKWLVCKEFRKTFARPKRASSILWHNCEIQRILPVAEWMCPREKSPESSASGSRIHGRGRQAKNAHKGKFPSWPRRPREKCDVQRCPRIATSPDDVGEIWSELTLNSTPRRVLAITDRAGPRALTTRVSGCARASRRAARAAAVADAYRSNRENTGNTGNTAAIPDLRARNTPKTFIYIDIFNLNLYIN